MMNFAGSLTVSSCHNILLVQQIQSPLRCPENHVSADCFCTAACCSLKLTCGFKSSCFAKILKSADVRNLVGGQSEHIIMNDSIVCFGREA